MSRLVARIVSVREGRGGLPQALHLRHGSQPLQVLEAWQEAGAWWLGEGEKSCYRVRSSAGDVYELLFDRQSRHWLLTRILD